MWRVQSSNTYYHPEYVELGEQPRKWLEKHKGIGDRTWLISQVKFGTWECESTRNCFFIKVKEFEGRKTVTILIRIRRLDPSHVLAYHVHAQ